MGGWVGREWLVCAALKQGRLGGRGRCPEWINIDGVGGEEKKKKKERFVMAYTIPLETPQLKPDKTLSRLSMVLSVPGLMSPFSP